MMPDDAWEPFIVLGVLVAVALLYVLIWRAVDQHSAQLICRQAQYDAMAGVDGTRYCVQVYGDYRIMPLAEVGK